MKTVTRHSIAYQSNVIVLNQAERNLLSKACKLLDEIAEAGIAGKIAAGSAAGNIDDILNDEKMLVIEQHECHV